MTLRRVLRKQEGKAGTGRDGGLWGGERGREGSAPREDGSVQIAATAGHVLLSGTCYGRGIVAEEWTAVVSPAGFCDIRQRKENTRK